MKYEPIYRWRYGLRHPAARAGSIALALSILALIAAASWRWPAAQERDRVNGEIASIRRATIDANNARALRDRYADAEVRVPDLERRLATPSTSASMAGALAKLASDTRVRLIAEAYQLDRDERDVHTLSAEVTISGRYAAIRSFAYGLGAMPTWTVLDELQVEAPAGTDVLRARLRIVTRFRQIQSPPERAGV